MCKILRYSICISHYVLTYLAFCHPLECTIRAFSTTPVSQQHNCWLIVDFDGTCTEKDTTPLLPKLAAEFSKDNESERLKRLNTFASLENEYFDLHNTAMSNIFVDGSKVSMKNALESLDDVSSTITKKLSDSGVLFGMSQTQSDYEDLVDYRGDKDENNFDEKSKLRKGCAEALANLIDQGWNFGVLSINWCPQLIGAVLLRPVSNIYSAIPERRNRKYAQHSFLPKVWSNHVSIDGIVKLEVPGANAKKERIASLKDSSQYRGDSIQIPFIVYIGDSSTDLLALLEADVGILIGSSQTVSKFAERWNVALSPLSSKSQEVTSTRQGQSSTVWTVNSWGEIEQFLSQILLNFSS